MNVVLVALVLLIAVWFFIKLKKPNKKPLKVARGKYHCVTVHYSKGACEAVMQFDGKRLLSDEAPVLPLTRCDAKKCHCHFEHHEERRVDERRDAYHKAFDEVSNSTMKLQSREKNDRRKG